MEDCCRPPKYLKSYMEEAYKLEYADKPPYSKLQEIFLDQLHGRDPVKTLEWITSTKSQKVRCKTSLIASIIQSQIAGSLIAWPRTVTYLHIKLFFHVSQVGSLSIDHLPCNNAAVHASVSTKRVKLGKRAARKDDIMGDFTELGSAVQGNSTAASQKKSKLVKTAHGSGALKCNHKAQTSILRRVR